jgi:hypothetical protein
MHVGVRVPGSRKECPKMSEPWEPYIIDHDVRADFAALWFRDGLPPDTAHALQIAQQNWEALPPLDGKAPLRAPRQPGLPIPALRIRQQRASTWRVSTRGCEFATSSLAKRAGSGSSMATGFMFDTTTERKAEGNRRPRLSRRARSCIRSRAGKAGNSQRSSPIRRRTTAESFCWTYANYAIMPTRRASASCSRGGGRHITDLRGVPGVGRRDDTARVKRTLAGSAA